MISLLQVCCTATSLTKYLASPQLALAAAMVKGKNKRTSYARLTPYAKGIIFGMFLAGSGLQEIADAVVKGDGSHPCQQTVAATVARCRAEGGTRWSGEVESTNRGAPRVTTAALDRKIRKVVFQHRGKAKVTVDFLRKKILSLRRVSRRTVARRLSEAGLAWLRRRQKSLVPAAHKKVRRAFARWVLKRTATTLQRWVYSDGASFYLARSVGEKESKLRAALGTHVWRMASGSDALYEDVVGPSSYWKAQGTCIRIWGLLVGGFLFVKVLSEGVAMNRWEYAKIVRQSFPGWCRAVMGRKARPILIQDHERALWTEEALDAIKDSGLELLTSYPKCSQDLNVIETAWRELRARLADTEPVRMESRGDFVKRLRLAVAWVNRNRQRYLRELCFAQKVRAQDLSLIHISEPTRPY